MKRWILAVCYDTTQALLMVGAGVVLFVLACFWLNWFRLGAAW